MTTPPPPRRQCKTNHTHARNQHVRFVDDVASRSKEINRKGFYSNTYRLNSVLLTKDCLGGARPKYTLFVSSIVNWSINQFKLYVLILNRMIRQDLAKGVSDHAYRALDIDPFSSPPNIVWNVCDGTEFKHHFWKMFWENAMGGANSIIVLSSIFCFCLRTVHASGSLWEFPDMFTG